MRQKINRRLCAKRRVHRATTAARLPDFDCVGVSNQFTFLKTIPPYWKPMRDIFYEMAGNRETDKKLLAEASPGLHADNICVPLLIGNGAGSAGRIRSNGGSAQEHGIPDRISGQGEQATRLP